jgi:hypothetical protein
VRYIVLRHLRYSRILEGESVLLRFCFGAVLAGNVRIHFHAVLDGNVRIHFHAVLAGNVRIHFRWKCTCPLSVCDRFRPNVLTL